MTPRTSLPRLAGTPGALALLGLLGLLAGSCTQPTIGGPCQAFGLPNGDACKEQLYFPSGLAIDPLNDALYVSNANADLRYSGGTVVAVNLKKFECARDFTLAGMPDSPPPSCARFPLIVCAIRYVHNNFKFEGFPGPTGACVGTGPLSCDGMTAAPSPCEVAPTSNDFRCQLQSLFPPDNQKRLAGPFFPDQANNPPALCRPDLASPAILECDEQLLIDDGVGVGNFAGDLRLRAAAPAPIAGDRAGPGACPSGEQYTGPGGIPLCFEKLKAVTNLGTDMGSDQQSVFGPSLPGTLDQWRSRRIFVAVRGDPSITWMDVAHSQHTCATAVRLACDKPIDGGRAPNACANQRMVVRDLSTPLGIADAGIAVAPGAACQPDGTNCTYLPSEPFGMYLDEGYKTDTCADGKACRLGQRCSDGKPCTLTAPYQRLLVTHLATGEVSLINAAVDRPTSLQEDYPRPGESERVVLDVRGGFFAANSAGLRGGFALEPQVPGDGRTLWYMSSRVNPVLANFRIANADTILPAGSVLLNVNSGGPYNLGDDVRGLAFDPCAPADPMAPLDNPGCRAFVIDSRPPSLFTLDTRIDPARVPAGTPINKVVDIIPTCQGPSHLAVRRLPSAGPMPRNRVYVLCYDAGAMAVIDPDLGRLVDIIPVGRGPNAIAFNFGPEVDEAGARPEAYVTNFLDMSVSVIDLAADSPTENRVVARIGYTEPPVTQ